ncbi:uncharacterized protein LOC110774273 [Prunus avium]|uniref:Uncharacterized protein LOC110746685 n=1 Tax=Prunus avium TaxID=42229 RepID=A0A6P5U5D1_PRUAV|nr:uncharacterized protein LOC110746685 [Prunus avium]XP_021834501.1 uncharacterized protein LOC110774273 [Prunus avium]XP_021834502.1 uncharacterized protein LOC110774273 [Prunus avium]
MQTIKKLCILHPFLLLLNFSLATSIPQDASTSICDKFKIQTPFSNPNSTALSRLNRTVICKSQKLYHSNRTSNSLFPVSYTNYKCKSLIISNPSASSSSSSSSLHHVSPLNPSNSLLLYNCSNKIPSSSPLFQNFTCLHACGLAPSSCLLVDDVTKLDVGFHPRDLNCSCYSRVHRRSLDGSYEAHKLRTRVSFDIPDHIPNICDECQKPNGNCAAGLRCICHPKECKNKVISKAGSINALGNILVSLLSLVALMVLADNP